MLSSFVTSWMSRHCALRVILVSQSLLGHFVLFSPFVDNGSHCGSLESRSLRNSFVTLSRLIDANGFVCVAFSDLLTYLTLSDKFFLRDLLIQRVLQ